MAASHHDPFSYLGLHRTGNKACLRVYAPHTKELFFGTKRSALARQGDTDFFEWNGLANQINDHELLTRIDNMGQSIDFYDAYSFSTLIEDFDLHLFSEGRHWHIYRVLGAHCKTIDGIDGVQFATCTCAFSNRMPWLAS